MEEEKRKKTTAEKIAELKKRIIGCKDPKLTEQLLNQLLGLHKQSLNEPVELIVPCKEVKETIDFGACKISKTIRGFLFEAKGGLYTFVDLRMQSICTMLQTLFDLHAKDDKTEDENTIYENFRDAVLYTFQAPIFASLNEKSLFEIATANLKTFNDYAEEHYTNAEAVDETEDDIRENIALQNASDALETLANPPLPHED